MSGGWRRCGTSGSDPSVVRTEEESLAFAHRQLGQNLRDLPFTLTYLFDDDGDARLAGTSGIAAGHPAAPALLPADGAAVWPVRGAARGESVLVDLDGEPYSELPTGDWPEPPAQALVVPLLQQGGASSGFLVAALNRYRPLDEGYRGFVTLVAGTYRGGNRQRPQLPRPAAAGRGARRARPRQDHVLLQHQPRVPHPADPDPRPGGRAARPDAAGWTIRRAQELDVV